MKSISILYVISSFVTILKASAGFSSLSTIPPPPPISVPVWSFATASQTKTSMNIMTFCIPVSVSSPKLWALSFYYGTLTKDSFLGCDQDDDDNDDENPGKTAVGILQLLKFDHRHLVPILGKQSGRDVDKSSLCSQEGFPWSSNQDCNFKVLPGCALYIEVECQNSQNLMDAGDHVVAICQVTRVGVWEQTDEKECKDGKIRWLDGGIDANTIPFGAIDESKALYSGHLRKEGIL